MTRREFLGMAAMTAAAGCTTDGLFGSHPYQLKRLGTIDIFIVEANPIVFRGKPWLLEYIRYFAPNKHYRTNDTGKSYLRFRDLTDLSHFTEPFGVDMHLGNAFVYDNRIVVTGKNAWGGDGFYQIESDDMVHWTEPRRILSGKGWQGYNTTMCRAGDKFVLAFELGKPAEKVGPNPFTMFFAESTDLRNWREIDGAVLGKDFYTGGPMLRHHDGWYYFFHLEGDYTNGFHEVVRRSRDLRNWERSPHIVMDFCACDKRLHPQVRFTDAQKAEIAAAKNINVSDHDFCEYGGKLLCSYSWGDQRGHEYLALAEADCTEREFCESYFK